MVSCGWGAIKLSRHNVVGPSASRSKCAILENRTLLVDALEMMGSSPCPHLAIPTAAKLALRLLTRQALSAPWMESALHDEKKLGVQLAAIEQDH